MADSIILPDFGDEPESDDFDGWDDAPEETCQHEWELRSEHDTWVCAWCQAETTAPHFRADEEQL